MKLLRDKSTPSPGSDGKLLDKWRRATLTAYGTDPLPHVLLDRTLAVNRADEGFDQHLSAAALALHGF